MKADLAMIAAQLSTIYLQSNLFNWIRSVPSKAIRSRMYSRREVLVHWKTIPSRKNPFANLVIRLLRIQLRRLHCRAHSCLPLQLPHRLEPTHSDACALLLQALDLGKAALGKIRQNLGWALAYNLVGIPLAAGALLPAFDISLSPTTAGGMMAFSSIAVVSNSLLLRRFGGGKAFGSSDCSQPGSSSSSGSSKNRGSLSPAKSIT